MTNFRFVGCLWILVILTYTSAFIIDADKSLNTTRNIEEYQICEYLNTGGGSAWSDSRIVGGVETEKNEFKWQISIQDSFGHICGGSIIDKDWIITAAHCLSYHTEQDLIFVAGDHMIGEYEGTEQVRKGEKFIIHENFHDTTIREDIALVKVSEPFDFSTLHVAPVCLPDDAQQFKGRCVATGWGTTTEGYLSKALQKVWLPLISDMECQRKYDELDFHGSISVAMICAGEEMGGKDTCQGDSGGPLICRGQRNLPMLAGIVSWGMGCARPNIPGVYTEVSYYVRWINEKTGLDGTKVAVANASAVAVAVANASAVADGSTTEMPTGGDGAIIIFINFTDVGSISLPVRVPLTDVPNPLDLVKELPQSSEETSEEDDSNELLTF